MEKILEQNKKLIERFVSLATLTDARIDRTHRWFYSCISKNDIELICYPAEDIRQDIIVFILEQYQNYTGNDFNSYLILSVSRFVKNRIETLIKQYKVVPITKPYETLDLMGLLDLRWLLQKDNLPITEWERYLLYLDLYKCYTINQICEITYQDRSTIRKSLFTARQIIKQELS